MASVPRYERQVRTAALPNARKQAAETPNSLGAGVGAAISETGETIARAGVRKFLEVQHEEREKANQIAHTEAMRRLSDWQLKRIHAADGALATRKGKAAQGLPEELGNEFESVADEIEASLTNDDQRARFGAARQGVRENVLLQTHRHVEREQAEYDKGEFNGYIANQKALASAQALDAVAVNQALDGAVRRTREYGQRNGHSPEAIEAQVAATRNEMWSSAITQSLAAGDDVMARSYFEGARDAGQLTGEALTKMTDAMKRGASDLQGERAADEIWSALGPKGDDDAISLDKMEEAVRKRFAEPELREAAIKALRSRKQGVDDGRRERREAVTGTLWRAVLEGADEKQIRRMPEFLTGKDEDVVRVVDYLQREREHQADRAYQLDDRARQQRERAEKAREDEGWYMRTQYDKPDVLLQMTENQIAALAPELGRQNTTELIERRRLYVKDAQAVREAQLEVDTFNELADQRDIPVHKVRKTEDDKRTIGAAKAAVRRELSAAQQAKGKQKLSVEEQREVVEKVLDRTVMVDGWIDRERLAATVVNPDDRKAAYVPIDRIPATKLTKTLNYVRGLPGAADLPESELRARFATRIQRAYAVYLMGGDEAEQLAILDGKER